MQLMSPAFTTSKYNSKGTKKPNTAASRKAATDYENWLRKQGLHPEQRKLVKAFKGEYKNALPDLKVESKIPLGNTIPVKGGFQRGVMANLHNESPEVQAAILDKASRVMPLFNKGGLQFATPGTDMTTVGSKSRR